MFTPRARLNREGPNDGDAIVTDIFWAAALADKEATYALTDANREERAAGEAALLASAAATGASTFSASQAALLAIAAANAGLDEAGVPAGAAGAALHRLRALTRATRSAAADTERAVARIERRAAGDAPIERADAAPGAWPVEEEEARKSG